MDGIAIGGNELIAGIVGVLVAFGVPKMLDRWQAHTQAKDTTLIGIVKETLEASQRLSLAAIESQREQTEAIKDLSAGYGAAVQILHSIDGKLASGLTAAVDDVPEQPIGTTE